jgi:hypothetical protein
MDADSQLMQSKKENNKLMHHDLSTLPEKMACLGMMK